MSAEFGMCNSIPILTKQHDYGKECYSRSPDQRYLIESQYNILFYDVSTVTYNITINIDEIIKDK